MGKIYVVGLGPGSVDDLTLGAINRINSGDKSFLRTEKHPTIDYFNENSIEYTTFDYLYETSEEFKDVYEDIANALVMEASLGEDINYYVPGNPLVAEQAVEILIEKKANIEIITGMSFIDPLIKSVERDPIDGLKIVDGTVFDFSMININEDIIITQVYNRRIITEVKLILSEVYGDEYEIFIIDSAGIKDKEKTEKTPIYLMDRFEDIGYLTSIYIPRIEKKDIYDFNDIIHIMKKLRGEDGCPWDMKQTYKSLRKSIIEEAYELVNAIDSEDLDDMVEEVGDLLLQVVFLTEIASDKGEFALIDVTTALANKLIYRHPHVFLAEKVANPEEIVYNWDGMKDSQRGFETTEEKIKHISNLPSLIRSFKTQEIVAKIGFDWDSIDGPLEKIKEEYGEILEVLESPEKDFEALEEEIGDLFFSVVNLARLLDVDPEVSMNKANNKFISRFRFMENQSLKGNKELKDMTLDEMERLWSLAKENNL